MIQWRFPSNDHGENKGINDSGVATFKVPSLNVINSFFIWSSPFRL